MKLSTAIHLLLVSVHRADAKGAPKFREDGTFTIVQFTDLHLQTSWHPPSETETVAVINSILDIEKPDFVAYTGDICEVSSGSCHEYVNHTHMFHTAFDPTENRGIPWAVTYGNWDRHPDAFMTGKQDNEFVISNFSYSCNKQPPADIEGDSVFDVPVAAAGASSSGSPAMVLYFMDTHANDGCGSKSGTGCIYPSEVAWYNATSAAYRKQNSGVPVPAMAFFHIPLPEHIAAWNTQKIYGRLDEPAGAHGLGVSCVIDSSNFFAAAVANQDIRAMTCGHDHDNDYHVNYQGIDVMYGRKTGFGSYGPPSSWGSFPDKDGARVIQFKLDPRTKDVAMTTWIRLKDGTRLDSSQEGAHSVGANLQTHCNSVALADALRHTVGIDDKGVAIAV